MPREKWRTEYRRLWKELVPATGQASTVQGELVRSIGRLSDEAFRNGNHNFGKGHRLFCNFLRKILDDPAIFSTEEIEEIKRCIKRVRASRNPDICGTDTSFHRLTEKVVKWCESHPEPIPREPDPELHI